MKDIFELSQEEKCKVIERKLALKYLFRRDKTRNFIAGNLYDAVYDDNRGLSEFLTGKETPPEEVLNIFCQIIFGASYQEVLKAYDDYLG